MHQHPFGHGRGRGPARAPAGQCHRRPVIGLGGICSAEDVLEFILVGAHAVQIGTANFISPDRAFEIVKELPAVCRQLGVTSLDELRGSLKTA